MTRSNKKTLPQLAHEIKTFEKRGIKDAIEVGKRLLEASEQCEHGAYMRWVETELDMSHSTALNYRNAYELSVKFPTVANLNLTQSAFYHVAEMNDDEDQQATIKAIVKEAKKRRVTLPIVFDIIQELQPALPEPPPQKPPPPIEPLDDDDDFDDDGDDGDDESHDDDDDDDDDEHHELITAFEKVMTTYWRLNSKAWPKVIKAIGPEKFGEFIVALQTIYTEHHKTSAVKSAADRAADRAEKSAKKMEKTDAA
jgi:hypothetical protein